MPLEERTYFNSNWKITPIFKKGDKSNVKNYRAISGLIQIGRLLEKLVLKHIIKLINSIFDDNNQHGCRPEKSIM